MSYTFNDEISYSDSPNLDAFGRLRVSQAETLVENFFLFDKEPLLVNELTAGTASATWSSASTISMVVGNTTGDRLVRQSRKYAPYQPGKSQFFVATGVLNDSGGVSGIRSRIGYFDDINDKSVGVIRGAGLFFELDGTTLYTVLRYTSGGTQFDVRTDQSSWNLDTLDGSGNENNPSGLQVDVSKAQIFVIDFQWLGVGRVRYGISMKGRIRYVHEITNYNVLSQPYMNTPSLPIRYEIENISGVTHSSKMTQICASVHSEADLSKIGKTLSVDSGVATRTLTTTLQPILSVKLKEDYNRATADLISYSIMNITSNRFVRWAIYLNPTLTSPTWVDNQITLQYDVTASAIDVSGAIQIASGYISDRAQMQELIKSALSLSADIDGTVDVITIAGQTVSSTADVLASIKLQQII